MTFFTLFHIFLMNIIVAMSQNRVIGKWNTLPWHYPEDLRHFKHITQGGVVLMGRKTYQSIGRPLPKRRNIILTTQKDFAITWCEVFHTLDEVITESYQSKKRWDNRNWFVIWGQSVYQQCLDRGVVEYVYLTLIPKVINDGDAFFPAFEHNFDNIKEEQRGELVFCEYRKKHDIRHW